MGIHKYWSAVNSRPSSSLVVAYSRMTLVWNGHFQSVYYWILDMASILKHSMYSMYTCAKLPLPYVPFVSYPCLFRRDKIYM